MIMKRRKKPKFLRQEWFRRPHALGKKWRRPKGKQSKLRKHIHGKGFLPSPGYGSPKNIRGLHPSGLTEYLVYNPSQIGSLDPKTHCIKIASGVGKKKRMEIAKKAKEIKIRVLNYKEPVKKEKKIEKKPEKKEEKKGEKK